MERINQEIIFEYEGPVDIAPLPRIFYVFTAKDHKITAKYTAGGKHIEIIVVKKEKELIA